MTTPIACAANTAWWLANLPVYLAFRAAVDEPARTQADLLRDAIERNANTEFGRHHRFDRIASPGDFARRVPIADYDALAGDIDRIADGEPNVLTAETVIRLATSSGSTRARKLIPYTRGLQREFNRAIGPWIVDLYSREPSLLVGCAYWSISPVVAAPREPRPAGAPPIGFDEDSSYLGGLAARLIDRVMAVPGDVRHIGHLDAFRFATARHLLARADLRLISVWHPSFLGLLLDEVARSWHRLLDDIARDGGRARAASLRDVDPTDVRAIWPRLRLISCWADAHAVADADALARRTDLPIQPKGLLATEAFVTIPFAGRWPVAVRSHVYEFLDDGGASRSIESLRDGHEYDVVVTTAGGLWRYRLGDRVRVDGFLGRTPSLRFVGRSDHVVDRRGEKLSEGFVGGVLRALVPTATFSVLAPEAFDCGTRYVLFVRSTDLPNDLSSRLDDALRANPHYAYCRELGQLAAPIVVLATADASQRLLHAEVASGRRLGDVKATALSGREDLRGLLADTD